MAKPGKNQPNKGNPPAQKPAEQAPKPAPKNISTPEPAKKAAPTASAPLPDLFDKLGSKGWLAALGIIFVIAFFVFKDYLLFDKVYLFKDIGSDTLNGLYPYIKYTAEQVSQHHFPQWSYSWGMGQNIFALVFRDPFDIFLFLSGKDHVVYGIVYKELAKVVLGGVLFFFYLRTLKLANFTAITGSILFAFCAFMIVGGGWSYFSFEAFSAALLLLAFELMFSQNKWILFPIAIFLIGISTPVNLYLYGLFLACYAVLRCFQEGKGNVKDIMSIMLKMAGWGLLGVLLCSPFILENIYIIKESPRGNGTSTYSHILSSAPMFATADKINFGTCIMRLFASDLLGSGNDFRGWQNILEAPMFYCGISSLVLVPQVFRFLSKTARTIFIIMLAIWLLPIIFPWFRYAFWLFSGDYYRGYSFFISLFLLFYSLKALDMIVKSQKVNLVVLIVTVVALLGLLNYPFFDKDALNTGLFTYANLMVLVYGALLFFMGRQNGPAYLKYIFLGAVVVEALWFSSVSVNQRDAITAPELSQKIGYNDYSNEAISFLKQHDNSFYRVDKNYASSPAMHYSLNDAMVQGYQGTSSYNSFNQGNYIAYLQLVGVVDARDELQTRWATGFINRPILESENRVKYILARKQFNPLWRYVCDSLASFGDVLVLKNKYVLPVGFTYDTYIRQSQYNPLSQVQKDFISLSACVVADEDVSKVNGLKEFQLKDTIAQSAFSFDIYRQHVDELAKDSLAVKEFGLREISGKANVPQDKVMFLTVPFDDGWSLEVDGQKTDKLKLSAGMTGIMLKKGTHDIKLTYHQRHLGAMLMVSLAALLAYIALWFFTRKRPGTDTAPQEVV